MTRAMILAGHSSFREILEGIFHSGFPAVELLAGENGITAMEKIASGHPDLILIGLKLAGDNAFTLTREIKSHYPQTIVVLLGSYDYPEYREAASRQGADYFMAKDSPAADYIALIESILSGRGRPAKKATH